MALNDVSQEDNQRGDALARAIHERRTALGLTQQQFADELGMNQSQVARWESGRTRALSSEGREALAKVGVNRVLLGISGLDFDQVEDLVDAARDAILKNGKPALGARLLTQSQGWVNLWHPQGGINGSRVNARQLGVISDVNFYRGLAYSIINTRPATRQVMQSMWLAERAALDIKNDDERYRRGSNALIISGNELRKSGSCGDAEIYLQRASQWSECANLPRRRAESLGLLAYVHADTGNLRESRAMLDAAGEALVDADGRGAVDVRESVFSDLSLAEVKLRCVTVAGSVGDLTQVCSNLEIPKGADRHWAVYYSNTAGRALLRLHDPDAFDWYEYVVREGTSLQAKGQLLKALRALRGIAGERAEVLRVAIKEYLSKTK